MGDFHGLDDWTVPRQYDHSPGEGPVGQVRTIMSWDALYYYYKPEYLDLVADSFNCGAWEPYLTHMDGIDEWSCQVRKQCQDDIKIVMCGGNYGHTYPFSQSEARVEAARILWSFFQNNPATKHDKVSSL